MKNETEKYGVKWAQWNKNDRRITKKKFFKTQQELDRFVERLVNKEEFISIEGWCGVQK